MKCPCGQPMKVIKFEEEDEPDFVFCPNCVADRMLASFTGLPMEDYKPEDDREITEDREKENVEAQRNDDEEEMVSEDDQDGSEEDEPVIIEESDDKDSEEEEESKVEEDDPDTINELVEKEKEDSEEDQEDLLYGG